MRPKGFCQGFENTSTLCPQARWRTWNAYGIVSLVWFCLRLLLFCVHLASLLLLRSLSGRGPRSTRHFYGRCVPILPLMGSKTPTANHCRKNYSICVVHSCASAVFSELKLSCRQVTERSSVYLLHERSFHGLTFERILKNIQHKSSTFLRGCFSELVSSCRVGVSRDSRTRSYTDKSF